MDLQYYRKFESERLPSRDLIWSWVKTINNFGPRLTGSIAQQSCVDFIATEFERIGLVVERDPRRLRRWEAEAWNLRITNSTNQELFISYPYPYSGRTPASGVTGEMVWFGKRPHNFKAATGKIAVVEVHAWRLCPIIRRLVASRKAAYPRDADIQEAERTPLLGGLLSTVSLARAAEAGVLAVIFVWRGCAEEDVKGQYLSFIAPYQDCPALWVGPAVGEVLRKAATRQGAAARLTLQARLDDDVRTETIHAVLPGTDPHETIIVNTHSDGPNVAEENGAAGVLALAHYFASLSQAARRRTMVFVVVTGHFQLPQLGNGGEAMKAWLDRHPDLWDGRRGHRRAVAGLTLEHLGCLEWKEDAAGESYGPTGQLEREIVYATNSTMRAIYRTAIEGRSKVRSLVVIPRNGFFFGEGEPWFINRIPSICLCPVPNYLCAFLRDGGIDRLDPELIHQQIATFAKALLQIDATEARRIGDADRDWTAFIGRLFRAIARISF
jgi:hypothetical protein